MTQAHRNPHSASDTFTEDGPPSAPIAATPIHHSPLTIHNSPFISALIALFGYLAIAVGYTWPMVTRFTTQTPASLLTDRDQMLWDFWWVRYAITELHQSPFHTSLVYWPDYQSPDVQLWFQALQPINAAIAFVLQPLIGLVASYNVIVLLAMTLAGFGAYLLVGYVSGSKLAGFIGGLAFTCFPFHMDMLKGQLHIFSLEFIPFYLYALLRLRDAVQSGQRRAILRWGGTAVLFLTLVALVDWYNLLYALMLTACLGLAYLWWGWRQGWGWTGRQVAAIAVVGVITFALLLPMILPAAKLLGDKNVWIQLPEQQRVLNSSDALAFFVPMPISTLGGPLADNVLGNVAAANPQCKGTLANCLQRRSYLGYAAIALAIIGTVGFWRKRSRFWLVVTLAFLVLALGPVLQLATANTNLPLPFALLAKLPGMDITRAPDRFLVPASVGFCVLVGLGVAWLRQRNRGWLAATLSLIMAIEYLTVPYPMATADAPPFFKQLGEDKAQYALFELPLTGHFLADSTRTRYQLYHHKAINGGYLARPLADNFSIMAQVQDWFADYTMPTDITSHNPQANITALLNAYDFRYVIIYKQEFGKESERDKATAFLSQIYPQGKVFEDGQIIAYRVPDVPFTAPLVVVAEGWHKAEPSQPPRRWIQRDRATLRLIVPQDKAGRYTLSFNAAAFAQPRTLSIAQAGQQVWQQQISTTPSEYHVPLTLPAGTTILTLTSDGYAAPAALGLDANDKREISVTFANIGLQ